MEVCSCSRGCAALDGHCCLMAAMGSLNIEAQRVCIFNFVAHAFFMTAGFRRCISKASSLLHDQLRPPSASRVDCNCVDQGTCQPVYKASVQAQLTQLVHFAANSLLVAAADPKFDICSVGCEFVQTSYLLLLNDCWVEPVVDCCCYRQHEARRAAIAARTAAERFRRADRCDRRKRSSARGRKTQ